MMATPKPTTQPPRSETLCDDVDALHRQLNTMGFRLAKAQARKRELETEVERLRVALADARNRFIEISHADRFRAPVDAAKDIASAASDRMKVALDGGGQKS